jgi:hypothetical protein
MDPARNDGFSSLTEGVSPSDAFTRFWLEQAILRMRRELCWLWHNPDQDRLA